MRLNRRHALASMCAAVLAAYSGVVSASGVGVWVLPSEQAWAYTEAVAALQTAWRHSGHSGKDLVILKARELPPGPPPQAVVALGAAALKIVQDRVNERPEWGRVPVMSALLQKSGFEAAWPHAPSWVSAAYLDQPLARYGALVRHAMPQVKRVAVLVSDASEQAALVKALGQQGLDAVTGVVSDAEDLFPVLSKILSDAQVFLLLPNARWGSPANLQRMLIAAYRQRVPVIAYSPALVKAGAVMALFASPQQVGQQVATMLSRPQVDALHVSHWPAHQWASAYTIEINEQVAHSLDLDLPHLKALMEAVGRERGAK